MNWFHVYRYTYKDFFFLPLVQKEIAFLIIVVWCTLFRDCFFFCRRGVTSLSSVSTRQTSYSHSKLTHNPKIFTASLSYNAFTKKLSCVWHFLDFVLIKTLVLTCNKRKIILYFVGCSELIFITMFCFHYMHNSLKIFLHLHILPFNPNY